MSLFEPFVEAGIPAANRLVRSATGESAAAPDSGCPTAAMAAFYGRLAAGGVGTIVSGHVAVSHEGRCHAGMSAFSEDSFIPAFAEITAACHGHGTPILCQLNHGGRQVNPKHEGIRAWCPSPVPAAAADFVPEELPQAEIERLINAYGAAAARCREAGFDGVQIHSAHGYLISQFNSPLTNQRQDDWGGSGARRHRFLAAVYEEIRRRTGPDYPIWVKQNVCDYHPDGLTLDEAVEICRMLADLGIAGIELSGGIGETIQMAFRADQVRRGNEVVFFEEEARVIRAAVSCPLILTGGILTAATATRLQTDNVCDAVGLCRPLIREPDLPRKWRQGSSDQAACTRCGQCKTTPKTCNYCALDEAPTGAVAASA